MPDPLVQGTAGFPWWNDTIFYEVFVRSFYDSNADGVGDLNGLIEKLDYLNDGDPTTTNDLGVTGIWLMPVMQSPSYHGYDVVDYYNIDEEYGTNEDFLRLVEEAHRRGIRVIVDLVLNHSSRQHPWFLDSQAADSDLRDWYIWEEESPGYLGPWSQTVWHRTPYGVYYGIFDSGMPDYNLTNPETTEALYDFTEFWLDDMRADGFRLDAIKHLIENGRLQEFTQDTHAWLEDYYDFYKGINPDAFAVGEAIGPTAQTVKFVGDETDIAFDFDISDAIITSARIGNNRTFNQAMQAAVRAYPPNQFGMFIRNHDQDRTLSSLDGNEEKARVAATLLLTSPGVPFIYYGEEIGQQGVRTGNSDENRRLPMQWTGEEHTAGFTTGRVWRPPFNDYPERNVAAQADDPDSLLSHYRRLIALRNEHAALRIGEWLPVTPGSAQVASYLRHHGDETFLILVNLSARPVERYGLELEEGPLSPDVTAVSMLDDTALAAPVVNAAGGFSDYRPLETLEPFEMHVIRLQQ